MYQSPDMFLGALGNFEETVILCDVINSSVMMWKIKVY